MRKLGDYKMSDTLISKTAYSNIYHGLDPSNVPVAIKQIKILELSGKKLTANPDIISDLLKNQTPGVCSLKKIFTDKPFVYFVLEWTNQSLAKELKIRSINPFSEREGLAIFISIIKGYKIFYKHSIIYKKLNPNNVLKFADNYKLTIPTTILSEACKINPPNMNDFELLYCAPEYLCEEIVDHKADIWSLGCILYHLLYGRVPWNYQCPKKHLKRKNPEDNYKIEKYALSLYIKYEGLKFPQNNNLNSSIIDLLTKMLDINHNTRISLPELLEHPFIDYFQYLMKNNIEGSSFNSMKADFVQSDYKNPDINKLYNNFEAQKTKSELEINSKTRKNWIGRHSMNPDKTNTKIIQPTKTENDIADELLDSDSIDVFTKLNDQVLQNVNSQQTGKISMMPDELLNTDELIKQLETALADNPTEEEENMNIEQLKNFIITIKKRILLKLKAFDKIHEVLVTSYVIAFKFFFLKSALYDFIKFEKLLLKEDNPFKSDYWVTFKKKHVFVKIVNSILNQQRRINDILDSYLYKTKALLNNSKINFSSKFMNYINDDPFQNCAELTNVLFKNLLDDHLVPKISLEADQEKKIRMMKLAILIKLILMIDDYGKFEKVDPSLEFVTLYEEIENSNDIVKIENKYLDLVVY